MHQHDSTSKFCWQTFKLGNYMKISLRWMLMTQVVHIAVMAGTHRNSMLPKGSPWSFPLVRVFPEASFICGLAGLI
ncbi:hypothetical protein I3760_06G042800 [Carya illinoinensis]|nr:hypothetical protein I3760_06G042800 [Carya illinoinensis]